MTWSHATKNDVFPPLALLHDGRLRCVVVVWTCGCCLLLLMLLLLLLLLLLLVSGDERR